MQRISAEHCYLNHACMQLIRLTPKGQYTALCYYMCIAAITNACGDQGYVSTLRTLISLLMALLFLQMRQN